MRLRHRENFVAVAEELHLSRAAAGSKATSRRRVFCNPVAGSEYLFCG